MEDFSFRILNIIFQGFQWTNRLDVKDLEPSHLSFQCAYCCVIRLHQRVLIMKLPSGKLVMDSSPLEYRMACRVSPTK